MFSWPIKHFAKGIAKTQLNTLRRIQKRNPELIGIKLYEKVISMRPGYDAEKVESIIRMTENALEISPINTGRKKINFRDVVYTLAVHEYIQTVGRSDDGGQSAALILEIVENIIPSEL